jgi:membrane-bound lytic murein transglycosylase B
MILRRMSEKISKKNEGMIRPIVLLLSAVFFLYLPTLSRADWSPLIDRLAADGFQKQELQELFSRPEVQFEPRAMSAKIESLLKYQIPPSEALTPSSKKKGVMKSFLRGKVIAKAKSFLRANKSTLETINTTYGVPEEIIVSIFLIETQLGEYVGDRIAFNRLASMALCGDLDTIRPYVSRKLLNPRSEEYARQRCREKADWAYNELKALLDYAQKSGFDPLSIPGSPLGAIGFCQFMPSNISPFGVDADQDGRIDLFATDDALHSMANYLRGHGWVENMPKSDQKKVIFEYNRCSVYANTVLAVADRLKGKTPPRQRLG